MSPAATASSAAGPFGTPRRPATKNTSAQIRPIPAPTSGKAQPAAAIAPVSGAAPPTGSRVSTAVAMTNSSKGPRRASIFGGEFRTCGRDARAPNRPSSRGRGFREAGGAVAHRLPGEAAGDQAEASVRGQPDRLQEHRDAALDMVRAVEGKRAPRVGAAALAAVIGPVGLVGGVIGVGELVVFRFGDPADRDPQPADPPQPLARQAAVELLVEQPVVAQFVGGDMAADLLQDWFGGGVAQRAVIGAGPDL